MIDEKKKEFNNDVFDEDIISKLYSDKEIKVMAMKNTDAHLKIMHKNYIKSIAG